jgi:hypothetical protein
MALELVYTSATKGLRAGTSGFCTVAMTRGLPPALVPRRWADTGQARRATVRRRSRSGGSTSRGASRTC